jgi:hypothetical protein
LQKLSGAWKQIRSNHHLRYWTPIISLILPVAFMLLLLSRSAGDLKQLNHWPSYLNALCVGVLLYPLSFITQALAWQKIIARLSQAVGSWHDLEIYARTYFIRRIPGVVWYLAGRTLMYQNKGIAAQVTLLASGLEWGLLIVASLITFAATTFAGGQNWWVVLLWLVGLCIVSACILAHLLNRLDRIPIPARLRSRFSNAMPDIHVSPVDIALWLVLFLWAYFVGGWILHILIHSVDSGLPVTMRQAWRVWSLSGGVGLLFSSVIPAGMGVRELTIAGLLAPDVPVSVSLIVSILLRFVFILSDLVWGGLLWAVARVAVRAENSHHRTVKDEKPA